MSNHQTQSPPMELDVKIYPKKNPDSSILAYAAVTLNGCFAVRGLKVVDGRKGLFVSMPNQQVKGEYKDICFPCTKEFKREFDRAVLDAYQQQVMEAAQEQAPPDWSGPQMSM